MTSSLGAREVLGTVLLSALLPGRLGFQKLVVRVFNVTQQRVLLRTVGVLHHCLETRETAFLLRIDELLFLAREPVALDLGLKVQTAVAKSCIAQAVMLKYEQLFIASTSIQHLHRGSTTWFRWTDGT